MPRSDPLTHPDHLIPEARQKDYAAAYATPTALTAGFDLYRALPADSEHNRKLKACTTPLLYLRGAYGIGKATTNLSTYRDGLAAAGNQAVTAALVPDSVHYLPEENPAGTWQAITVATSSPTERAPGGQRRPSRGPLTAVSPALTRVLPLPIM
ncbi:hypothetical protein ABGB18_41400 [Nonomuraea sp. B12E4]|uniref:hypothetical protein n=1 Tax=Nonomuraea sp. B12E4 TaxID=3153564 RepID=UPI00325EB77C